MAISLFPISINLHTTAIKLHVVISKEDDEEQFSVVALNLPGCASCGETEDEAIENITEAARGLIESYNDANRQTPWNNTSIHAAAPVYFC